MKAKTLQTPISAATSDQVSKYASDVLSGEILAGRFVRLACARHLKDLEDGPKRGLAWDPRAANRGINFFPDVLRLAEGEHAGKPFVLQPWQQFIVGSIFGWKTIDGFRRFRTAYIEIGKGNGKSPMAGGIGLYMLTADAEAGAECYAAATTREQAGILFRDAVHMVDASPALSARLQKSGNRQVFNLAHLASGSFFRPISSEGRGLDGKRVHFAALDEIHEHPTDIVVEKMRAGTKGRRQALIFEITNSGYDRHTICWQHHEFSERVLDGTTPNDQWFAYVCTLDKGDDWHDERVWPKVNPNLGVSIHAKYLREQVAEADGMPSKQGIVERLNFCIWNEHAKRWIDPEKWDACSGDMLQAQLEEFLAGELCYGGFDLALTRDLSAFALVFPPSAKHSDWKLLTWFWCPEDDVKIRSKRDHVPYQLWVNDGSLCATPGNVTDFDFIEQKIKEARKKYQIKQIGYDKAMATQLVTHLQAEGCEMVEIPQNAMAMNSPIRTVEKLILEKNIAHGGHKILRWNATNAVLRLDSNGNVKFDKEKAIERIDGMSATADAFWCAIAAPVPSEPRVIVL